MLFTEAFSEALNKPYKIETILDKNGWKQYGFETDNGLYYVVSLLEDENTGSISITFETEDGNVGMTGDGDAFRILATVKYILLKNKSFLTQGSEVSFSAHKGEKGRVKLYDRLAKDVKKFLKYKTLRKEDEGIEYTYRISP